MKTYLVTGAAGFIGANYIKYILAKHNDIKVVILDALTYAGNLGTIAKDIDNERCVFIKGDICSRDVVDGLFAEYRFDYVVNFAAESHVDRSIENPQLFLITNILGTQNLLDCARRAWVMGKDEQGYPTWRKGVRYHQVSTDEVYGSLGAEGYFTEATPLCPHSPYSASKTSADMVVMAYHDTYKMPVTITRCSNNYGPYPGSAEENFGKVLKHELAPYRDELIISTKAGYGMWDGPYGDRGSRKYLIASLDQSLKRMGLEYVDIFYHHRPDPDTPMEETASALDHIVRSGKALYVGISNYNAEQTKQMAEIMKSLGTPLVIHQPRYNMFERWIENGLQDVLKLSLIHI